MSDFNQCAFVGRLGADPEIKSFQSGGRICNFRIAVGEQWKTKDGEKKERTEWVSVTINNDGLIGVAERFLRKGSRVLIQGKMVTRKWQDQAGADRYSTEIVLGAFGGILQMLDGKPDGADRSGDTRENVQTFGNGGPQTRGGFDDLDSDIPFARNDTVW